MRIVFTLACLAVLTCAQPAQEHKIRAGSDPSYNIIVLRGPDIEVLASDRNYLYAARAQTVYKLAKKDLSIVAQQTLIGVGREREPAGPILDLVEGQEVDIRDALRTLFRTVNVSYSIHPDIKGKVTFRAENKPFETVLRQVLDQIDATVRVESGVYQFIPKGQALYPEWPQIKHLVVDKTDVFVSIGSKIVRLSKRDLSFVSERELN